MPRDSKARAHSRSDDGDAFIRDPGGGPAHSVLEEAESLAEHFISSATSAHELEAEDTDDVLTAFSIYDMEGKPVVRASARGGRA